MAKAKASKAKAAAKKAPSKKPAKAAMTEAELIALIESAPVVTNYREWDTVVKHLDAGKASIASASAAVQLRYWQAYYEAISVVNRKKAVDAARALLECNPKASAADRALRTATLAKAQNEAKTTDGYDTFQKALKLASDDNTRAEVLLSWVEAEHDQVTPAAALLDAYELVKAGKLSPELTAKVCDRVAHAWPVASSDKATKAQDKLVAQRKVDRDAMVIDACRRYLELSPKASNELVFAVTTLAKRLAGGEAKALYKKWKPTIDKAYKAEQIDYMTYEQHWKSALGA